MQFYGSSFTGPKNYSFGSGSASSTYSTNSLLDALLQASKKAEQKVEQKSETKMHNFNCTCADCEMPALDSDDSLSGFPASKCNFVVKVMKPGSTESEVVFSESATLGKDEDVFSKLVSMTKNTPYEKAVSSVFESQNIFSKPEQKTEIKVEPKAESKPEPKVIKLADWISAPCSCSYYNPVETTATTKPTMVPTFMSATPMTSSSDSLLKLFDLLAVSPCACSMCKPVTVKPVTVKPTTTATSYDDIQKLFYPKTTSANSTYDKLLASYGELDKLYNDYYKLYGSSSSSLGSLSSLSSTTSSYALNTTIGAMAIGALFGAGIGMLAAKAKPETETETETKSEDTESIKISTSSTSFEPVQTVQVEKAKVAEVDPADQFTDSELTFFRDHFKNYSGDVSKLTPRFKALYDMFNEKPKPVQPVEPVLPPVKMPYVAPTIGYTTEGKEMKLNKDGTIDVDTSVPGYYFNEMYKNCRVVKLTNKTCCHNGLQYYEGLNIDTNEFKHDIDSGNGMYFCREADAGDWWSYGPSDMVYAWDVKIPHDARVVVYDNKLKADQFELSNKRSIASLVAGRIDTMVYGGYDVKDIVAYIMKFKYNSSVIESAELSTRIINLLKVYPAAFADLPYYVKNMSVCTTAAQVYAQAYYHLPAQFKNDSCILMYCVMKNPDVFFDIPTEHKTQYICDAAFQGSTATYIAIPDAMKTLDMSKVFVELDECATEYVPTVHKNNAELIDAILSVNPYEISNIYFKNLTKQRCLNVVEIDGLTLSLIPVALLDSIICTAAVKDNAEAYTSVPTEFRTSELKHILIDCHPDAISKLGVSDITERMLERITAENPALLAEVSADYYKASFLSFSMNNGTLDKLIDIDPRCVLYVPNSCLPYPGVMKAISKDNSIYWKIKDTYGPICFDQKRFAIDSVKKGVAFRAIPREAVTMSLLKELVNSRADLIDELSSRYLSDVLYIEAIKTHNYDHSKIDDSFMTPNLMAVIAERNPKSAQALSSIEAAIEFELEKSMLN